MSVLYTFLDYYEFFLPNSGFCYEIIVINFNIILPVSDECLHNTGWEAGKDNDLQYFKKNYAG